MDAQKLLVAAVSGDLSTIKSLQVTLESRLAFQVAGPDGNNALHLALLNGQWKAALYLMREVKVSQHKLNAVKESVLHSYLRGLKSHAPPTMADFAEFREEQLQAWQDEYALKMEKQNQIIRSSPELQPLASETVEVRDQDIFGHLELTMLKYFIESGHVYLYTVSAAGLTCKDLANSLGFSYLAEFLENEMKPAAAKRRLIQGLSEDLFREVAEFL